MVSLYAVRQAQDVAEDTEAIVALARQSLEHQSSVIAHLASRLGNNYCRALALILAGSGRLVISGVGKSGLIARKIAATFSSTGTPSFFLHPTEALHGDLGMVSPGDVALLISNSGETEEIMRLLPPLRDRQVRTIALVGDLKSTIGQRVDVALDVSVDREACPLNLVPTSSTLAAHAMGDALAISAMRARNFASTDFAQLHPAGHLGKRLLCRVRDAMRRHQLPFVPPSETVRECVMAMTRGRCGLAIVMEDDQLRGLVTDGDLRRALQGRPDALESRVAEIMTISPVTISEDASLAEAEERMHRLRLKALIVLNSTQEVVGLVEIFDG